LPQSDNDQPASMPGKGRAKWVVVQVGEIDSREIPAAVRDWLSQAQATVCLDAPPPIKIAGSPDRDIQRATSRDGHRQVSLSVAERKVNLRDADGRLLRSWDAGPGFIRIAISPSGKEVAIVRETRNAEGRGGQLTIYDADSGGALRSVHKADPQDIGSIAIDPQERTLVTFGGSEVALRDYKTLEEIAVLTKSQDGAGRQMTYSPNGRFVASHTFPIRLYDPTTLAPVKILPTPFRGRWFRFTPDEKRVLAGQEFAEECQLLTMLDIDSGRPLWNRSGPSGGAVTFSPDGDRFLVSWARWSPQLAVLWDAAAGEVLCVVLAPNRPETEPVFSRDGASVHLGTPDGPRLWPRD
jgi:WD40 repeat protein